MRGSILGAALLLLYGLVSGCSAGVQTQTHISAENPYGLSVTLLDGTPTEPYTIKKITKLVDLAVGEFESHFRARYTEKRLNEAQLEAVYYTEIYITDSEEYLRDTCNYDPCPTCPNMQLHGCTLTANGDVWLRHRGRLCDSALVHELYHKYLHALTDSWDYDHDDIGWQLVVTPTDMAACDFDELG
jgi:hypothetical protein